VISGLRVPVHLTSRESLRMFDLADIWATRTGSDVRLVSANDHVHSRGSAGYRVLWKVPGHYGHVHVEDAHGRPSPRPVPWSEVARHASTRRSRASSRVGG
jgi:hypothetical protein